MIVKPVRVRRHAPYAGAYRLLVLDAPDIAAAVRPGQFIHLRVPGFEGGVLRRPFSVFKAEAGTVAILYKTVGRGTRAMEALAEGDTVSVLGPLGNGFPLDLEGRRPVLVAGGYGVAPLYFLAARLPARGVLLVGGKTAADILCVPEFEALGWRVRVTTEDGSAGERGVATDLLGSSPGFAPAVYACGPDGMLQAVAERAIREGWPAWLSLDKHMGCGVGACLACVQKIREPNGTVVWKRVCRDGPVFEAREIVWQN